jgi:Na+-transporting NADH:ubiquinone oxidoreductase subunit C
MPPATIGRGASKVSESQPNLGPSNAQTILFMVILSFACALILSILASVLEKPKEIAKDLDRSKQMMIAARILDHEGRFWLRDAEGKYIPAKYYKDGILVPGTQEGSATNQQLLEVYKKRLVPMLVDNKGNLTTFEDAKIKQDEYLAAYKKTGYYRQPLKLIYLILPNPKENETTPPENIKPEGYVIPVNGFGLWDAIYGYLAVQPDGNTVIGISWYDQKETPGLGANMADAPWQSLFPGKHIFQESPNGTTDFKTAPLGIVVVKGKVADVLGNVPKAKSAVDGMAGATLTGNGITDAYKEVLAAYRPFLLKINVENNKK